MHQLGELRRLYSEVRGAFPFEGYMDEEGEGEIFVASELSRLAPPGARLLDIGCGPLDKTALFSRMGFECYACDDFLDPWHRQQDTMKRIRDFAADNDIVLHVHEHGDYSIPFPAESFDVVCIFGVIEHLHESPREILATAGRMLGDGGIVAIVMPNSVNVRKRVWVAMGRSNFPDVEGFFASQGVWRGHVREYTLSETTYIVRASGFNVERATTFNSMISRRLRSSFLASAFRLLGVLVPTLRDSLLVVGRKPEGWRPVEFDEEVYRAAIARTAPSAPS